MSTDRVFIEPAERRQAMLDIIDRARERLVLSLFRCNDDGVLDALAAARARGVLVQAILTRRAKGGRKRLEKLSEALDRMGAAVHWYADPVVKYHAKYMLADDRRAVIATLNPTKKCFRRTIDLVLTTEDPAVVRSIGTLFDADASAQRLTERHALAERLIVGPEGARPRIRSLIANARRRIQLLDHKLSDPDLVALLRERREAGVSISVIGDQLSGPLVPHGKLLIVDDSRAVFGSMALSALSLDFRREVSIVVDDAAVVERLSAFYEELATRTSGPLSQLPGDRAA